MTLEKVYDELLSMIEDLRTGQRLADNAIADLQKETQGAQERSGNPISISDAAQINAEVLTVTLEPIQAGSGDPSSTNIRPITGYTECEVDDVGFNLWDEEWELGNLNDQTGEEVIATDRIRSKGFIPVLPNTNYYCKFNALHKVVFYDENKTFISGGDTRWVTNDSYTTANGCRYIKFVMAAAYGTTYNHDICINISKPTGAPKNGDYVPYHSSNATIQFGQTVYGGTVDFKTGVLTVDSGIIASYNGETLPSTWISDRDVYVAGTTPTTGAQVCYKLAEPTTIQLTPAELKLLQGVNNITTNGTTIQLTYQPDNVLGQVLAVSEADDASILNAAKAYADSVVTITPALESGTKLADYTISGTAGIIYGPGETQATRKTTKKSTKEE